MNEESILALRRLISFDVQKEKISSVEGVRYIYELSEKYKPIYDYLQSKTDFTTSQLEENTRDSIFHDFAEGYFRIGSLDPHFYNLSKNLYQLWLNKAIEKQNESRERIHKGTQYHQIGWIDFNIQNNREEAYKSFVNGMIEDIIQSKKDKRKVRECPGYITLIETYNFPKGVVSKLEKAIESDSLSPNIAIQNVRNSVKIPTYIDLMTTNINKVEGLKNQWRKLNKAASNGNYKQDSTEFTVFAEGLISSITGFECVGRDLWAIEDIVNKKEHDYDLLFRNTTHYKEEFGTYIIVECKFWKNTVGFEELASLFYKLKTKRCSFGILFAYNGLKNKAQDNTTIREIYNDNGIVIVVIDQSDINQIMEDDANLNSLLLDKYENSRFRLKPKIL